jgi:hypothetical protein
MTELACNPPKVFVHSIEGGLGAAVEGGTKTNNTKAMNNSVAIFLVNLE